jgi:hypothetical protein
MDWFGWRLSKDPDKAVFGPQAILHILDKRVPQYRAAVASNNRLPNDHHGRILTRYKSNGR